VKILHVETGKRWLGGPQQVLYLMHGLEDRGISTCLVTCRNSALGDRAESTGLMVRRSSFVGDIDPQLTIAIIKAALKFRPHIIHLHSRRGADVQGVWAARFFGVPVVLSRRVDYKLRTDSFTKKRYAQSYDHIIAISEAIRQVLISCGVEESLVTTVHSAVDTETFKPDPAMNMVARQLLSVPPESTLFAIVAQMIPRKGHETAFRAVQRLKADHPEARLAVFGKGAEENRLRALAKELGIERQVIWAGFHENMQRVLPGIDCLVHPARLEGLGVAILQAAACGKPVIACPVGGIPEAVKSPRTGWLVPVDDDAALWLAMRAVIDDPMGAIARGMAGRSLMEREFSVKSMVEGNIAVYDWVLKTRT